LRGPLREAARERTPQKAQLLPGPAQGKLLQAGAARPGPIAARPGQAAQAERRMPVQWMAA
jgi:hypothetical protein